jgi:hypothetical protein
MSSEKYINDIIEGCILITDITTFIENMKRLQIGCIPFNLETKIQTLLESAYILVDSSDEKIFSNIQPSQEEAMEQKESPILRLNIPESKPKSLQKLFKTLLKQVLQYFEDRNKNQSNLTILEKRNEINRTIEEIHNIAYLTVPIPSILSLYANNFREHAEFIMLQLTIVFKMFPLE